MIFVTVGTNEAPFDRLLRAVDSLGFDDLVAQCGSSAIRPKNATCFDFLAFEQLVEYVRSASVVITHAGVVSIAVSLANGKRPIVVPRLERYGEAVDDHQVALGRRLEQRGLVTMVEEPAALTHLRFAAKPPPETREMSSALAKDLSGYLQGLVTERQGFSKRRDAATVKGERGEGNCLRLR